MDDPPPTAQHTDAAAPKLSLTDKLKQKIKKPIDGVRNWPKKAVKNYKEYRLAYNFWGFLIGVPSVFGITCGFLHLTAVKKNKANNDKMRKCDKAMDRGEPVPSAMLKSRDISSDEDSVLVARSPGRTKSSGRSGSSGDAGKKAGKKSAGACQKVKYKPRHPKCEL